jgi:hypothetical protein
MAPAVLWEDHLGRCLVEARLSPPLNLPQNLLKTEENYRNLSQETRIVLNIGCFVTYVVYSEEDW